jgi:hypothetical protein
VLVATLGTDRLGDVARGLAQALAR